MTEHIYREPLTTEEDTEARLRDLLAHDYAILRAAKSQGASIGTAGGHDHVISNPASVGLEPPPPGDEHPTLKLPIVLRRGIELPMEGGRTLTPIQFYDRFMKTPAKKRKFLLGCTRPPKLSRFVAIEAGPEFERRAIEATDGLAVDDAGAQPGDEVRAVLLDCRDAELAKEIVETNRGTLPWATVEIRPDGEMPAGWHGGQLASDEQGVLREQMARDMRAKQERRDRVVREMQRNPL